MRREKILRRDMAKERIGILFRLAEKTFDESPKMSNHYVEIARKISMRYNVRFSKEQRRRICHRCYSFLVPGANCRVRLGGKHVTVSCLNCGGCMRYQYNIRRI